MTGSPAQFDGEHQPIHVWEWLVDEEEENMRFMRSVVAVAMSAILGFGALGMAPASAESVAAWMTVATNHPAAGCIVDTSVEVQSGGAPVVGAEVSIILSDDASTTVIDSMATTTTETGFAWMSFNTSGAPEKTWLEVRVNGQYLGGRTIWVDGSECAGAPSVLDLSGDVPTVSDTWVSAPVTESAGAVTSSGSSFLPVVTYQQQRPLSCEYAAVQIATSMIGYTVSEYEMEAVTPLSANPHWGYRGNIWGQWGNTTDYGIYANALIPGLNYYGYSATSFYGDATDLTSYLDNGAPVIVWLGMRGDLSHDEYTEDGTRYQVTQYMHVMVVYGYDEWGVYLSDPGSGNALYYDWATFNSMWQTMDGMALAVGN
jgi:uncharacterized protein YvpB